MPTYRRAYAPGGTFFLTVVTYDRTPVFADSRNVARRQRVLETVKKEHPCEIVKVPNFSDIKRTVDA